MNKQTSSLSEQLSHAVLDESLEDVQATIEAGADVNALGLYNETPLYMACNHELPQIARFLLSYPGIDITKGRISRWPQGVAGYVLPSKDLHNTTPLYAAIRNGHLSIARMILNHPDKEKYLKADKNWASTIKGTFNFMFDGESLGVLLDAAAPYPSLHQFTIDCSLEYAFSWHEVAPELAALLHRRKNNELRLTLRPLGKLISRFVHEDNVDSLEYTLEHANCFCNLEELQPELEAAKQVAVEKMQPRCVLLLQKALASRVG
ncbi:MAG: ankyrin repeat domain-containing protein [Akkermansia sp.]|nr:ankyrin repeat domain-containing protein [Akkermansia sp.]